MGEQARALPFAVLGQRIGSKGFRIGWRQQVPVVFMAFDPDVCGRRAAAGTASARETQSAEAVVEELVERWRRR